MLLQIGDPIVTPTGGLGVWTSSACTESQKNNTSGIGAEMSVSCTLRAAAIPGHRDLQQLPLAQPPLEIVAGSKSASETTSPIAALDAVGRIAKLTEAFEKPDAAETKAADWSIDTFGRKLWKQHTRILKSLLGVVVVVAAGWMPVRALLETTSTEAVINARLITLRAPIEGQIGPLGAATVGMEIAARCGSCLHCQPARRSSAAG